ncbi:hypothetical protein GCM10027429_14160 [Marivirga atlantica]|uniref:SH3 domain-containing protein n=1 Tax=Marivirga atlantica TaxID=1548457 RepID=A0A937DGQ3_9BACT|nr:hypothetical protein [Marivirga atlantica]MBL0765033.1 hypothetical protein [Marivirga atlantica]
MQKVTFNFLILVFGTLLFAPKNIFGNPSESELIKADSLYENKQYTEAIKIYEELFSDGYASPNMLLKLARVNEGSTNFGATIFYLEKYYQLTGDKRILEHIEKITSDNKIEGFSYELPFYANYYYKSYSKFILLTLILITVVFLAFWLQNKKERKGFATAAIFTLVLIAVVNNYHGQDYGIITDTPGFLMEGPSAGADVITKLDQPTKLPLKGQVDIWTKTKVDDKEAYIKSEHLKKL